MTVVVAGLVAGFVHVLSGPDHLAAIAPYAVDGKERAWRTGIRWGLGHGVGVLGAALLAFALRHALPLAALSTWAERCVGLVLIGIGLRGMRGALAEQQPHVHGQAVFAVGTVHGLAGSSHLLGILPALALPSDSAAAAYLLLFGAGSIAAMGTFSSLVGWLAERPRLSHVAARSTLLRLCSLAAIAVGGWWLLASPG